MSEQICPHSTSLPKLIAGTLAEADERLLEIHLDHCTACQQALEQLVDSQSGGLTSTFTPEDEPSGRLREVMRRLKTEKPATKSRIDIPTSHLILGEVLEPSEDSQVLGKLGGYDVLEFLGEGGMGVVVKARDCSLDRIVAIKILRPELAARQVARERFIREAKSAASIHHPHVVTVHAVDDSAPVPYLVMEYVAGETLQDRIDHRGSMPWQDVARLAVELLDGLEVAHRRGLIHRDMKPANVLLDAETGNAKISDFGLVKAMDDDLGLTASGTIAGTPEFMSPEQAAAHLPLDVRSDLFSVGTIMYTTVAGDSPFRAASAVATLRRVCDEEPKPLLQTQPNTPRWLADVVHRLLRKSPRERYPSARDVAAAIRAGISSDAEQSSATWRGKAGVVLASLVVTVTLLALFSRSWFSTTDDRQDGIYIVGSDLRHDSLAAAVNVAKDGDTILVFGDREYSTSGVTLESRSLTLRAADGSLPTICSPQGRPASRPAIRSSAGLRIEGLKFKWAFAAEGPAGLERSVVAVASGPLSITNCEFDVQGRSTGIGTNDLAVILNCRFTSADGAGILLVPSDTSQVTVKNCAFQGRVGVFVVADLQEATDAQLRLERNTFRTESAIQITRSESAERTLEILARANVFEVTLHVFGHAGLRRMRINNRTLDGFRRRFAWSQDQENIFSDDCRFLVLERFGGGEVIFSLDTHADWLTFWGLERNTLVRESEAQVGVDQAVLGSGPGFQQFQQHQDYADWLRSQ